MSEGVVWAAAALSAFPSVRKVLSRSMTAVDGTAFEDAPAFASLGVTAAPTTGKLASRLGPSDARRFGGAK
ncbi:hypothetical protein [Streptomyces virginiae]|uniref:hypothetical protein n=1 Tax=Streptomyces virginiae TaxID=1961 RepID=UPI003243BCC4